ncbi:class III lanthionine synthetase LanKC [Kribbella sp. NPDC006257]|uniref:class III lanthionine synthetase LanKC n=1 Tax=Kribbella sp. NPDC006257 TaxID=3156738 RepID=UPI0033B14E6A
MEQYELYCLADRLFYDLPADRGATDFAACGRTVPAGWQHQSGDVWMNYAPVDAGLPQQGWKIHVSAGLDDAEQAIATVWEYCVPRGLAFKFLRSRPVQVMFNSKSAFRGSSGKLITIYPVDETQLELVLKELDGLLDGIQGPYILSDLRYSAGPLFVRYGAFATRYCLSESGERVYALADADGRLVPDVRGATFAVPPWVTLPPFLEPHLQARNAIRVDGLDYVIENVIQFSNGGGVYLGHHRDTERKVVLKEGRPLAGLDVLGRDAVTRVGHERDILERLAGLDVVPAVHDYLVLGEHHFLVQEFVDSNPLQRLIVQRYPLTRPDSQPADRAAYAEWALGMLARIEEAVAALHGRGVVFNDLHPGNVLVDGDGRLVLIDFEVATLATEQARSALAHPGYAAPSDRQGVDVDRYALACLTLGLFAPQTTMLLSLQPQKAYQLADLVHETFQVPKETVQAAADLIVGNRPATPTEAPQPGRATWAEARGAVVRAIVASATPERTDRLFPGDIAQFEPGGGVNLAHGAAGVLYALARCGADRVPAYEDWLARQARDQAIGPGLYAGLHGIALVLSELGRPADALEILDRCLTQPVGVRELGLYAGLAGIGLTLLDFAAQPAALAAATRIVDELADRLGGPEDVGRLSGEGKPRAGLMFGSSGPALLFLHAYELFGDTGLLDLVRIALRQDLRRCTTVEPGMLQVDQGWRTLPYLEEGSVGIAMVLDRYLRHRPDDELAAALEPLRKVTHCEYFVQPGLFMGRAGLLLAAAQLEPAVQDQLIDGFAWHALSYGDGLAFPGNQLLRLSMDLATGSAGILLALGAALHEQPVGLPFLGRRPAPEPFGPGKEV